MPTFTGRLVRVLILSALSSAVARAGLPDPSAIELRASALVGVSPQKAMTLFLTKKDGAWSASSTANVGDSTVERLKINVATGDVYLDAAVQEPPADRDATGPVTRWACFASGQPKRFKDDYSICASNFNKGDNTGGDQVLVGMSLLFGRSGIRTVKAVDTSALEAALQQANVRGLVVQARTESNDAVLRDYRDLVANARTVGDYSRLASLAALADPDGVGEKAKQRVLELQSQASAERDAKEEAKRRLEVERRALESQRRALESQRIAVWRQTVKVGSDTFCGPVIEVRSPMYRIAVRAQLRGFSNEQWLKQEELFPSDYGCTNTDGRLSAG